MAWIESHQSLSKHKKTLRAAGLLGVDRHKLIGHLHQLWWWAVDNLPPNGCLGDLTDVEIAMAAEWTGDPTAFVDALTKAGDPGFIEWVDDKRYLHDWSDYSGRLAERRAKERKRSRDRRATAQQPVVQPTDRPADTPKVDQQTTVGTVQYSTEHNTTEETTLPPIGGVDADGADEHKPDRETDNGTRNGVVTPERVMSLWNAICGDVLPPIRKLTDERRRKVRARNREEPGRNETWWREYFARIRASPFLCGEKGWRADFDFAVRSENVVNKVLEGRYDPPPGKSLSAADASLLHYAAGERGVDDDPY